MFNLRNPELKFLCMEISIIIVILCVLDIVYITISENQRKKVELIEDEWFSILKSNYKNGLKQSYDLATYTISNKYHINKYIMRHYIPYNEEDLKIQIELEDAELN